MPDPSRIQDLQRRVDSDPASIAFAQLAEEHRRAGDFREAVKVARAGLEQHPAYLSARVTLGRALMELERFDEARGEFEYVLLSAPDNLIALRSLAEIHQRRGDLGDAFKHYTDALDAAAAPPSPVRADPVPASPVPALARPEPAPGPVIAPPDRVLAQLESWLASILADRAARAAS